MKMSWDSSWAVRVGFGRGKSLSDATREGDVDAEAEAVASGRSVLHAPQ